MTEPLIDPDCKGGAKCTACVGGPCEHECHYTVDLDPADEMLVNAVKVLGQQIAALQGQLDTLHEHRDRFVLQLKEKIGDGHVARLKGKPVITYRPSKATTRIAWSELYEDHPDMEDLIEGYRRANKAARPFRLLDDEAP